MKRETISTLVVFALLVALGAVTRVQLGTVLPNFTAVGAVALFSGFYFRSKLVAGMTPLAAMVSSNMFLPNYMEFGQLALVYVAWLVPLALGRLLRGRWNGFRVVGSSLASSISFFLITNFAYWWFYDRYPHTWEGLIQGYAAGLPFFQHTLIADLLFSGLLFGTYALAAHWGYAPWRREAAVAAVPPE